MNMKKNNKNTISSLLSAGFTPDTQTRMRIEEKLNQKIAPQPRFNFRQGLVFAGILLLLGVGLILKYSSQKEVLMGPNAMPNMITQNAFEGQNFGESGPRGFETNTNYVHFQ